MVCSSGSANKQDSPYIEFRNACVSKPQGKPIVIRTTQKQDLYYGHWYLFKNEVGAVPDSASGEVVVTINDNNPAHCLQDLLFSLTLAPREPPLLFFPPNDTVCGQMLALTGFLDNRKIRDKGGCFERVIVPKYNNARFPLHTHEKFRSRQLTKGDFMALYDRAQPPQALFISRKGRRRCFSNAEKLHELLPMKSVVVSGPERIDGKTISVKEQVDFLQKFRYIIGPHGGWTAFGLFLQPGTTVIEIICDKRTSWITGWANWTHLNYRRAIADAPSCSNHNDERGIKFETLLKLMN